MRLNKFFKVCFGVALFLLVSLAFSTNNVQAAYGEITSGDITSEVVEQLPSKIKVNVKESEYKKAEKLIFNTIVEELGKIGIVLEEKEGTISASGRVCVYTNFTVSEESAIADIRSVTIEVLPGNITKNIEIEYSNSGKFNTSDKNYIDNIVKKLNLNNIVNVNMEEDINKDNISEDFLRKQINDDSIVLDPCGSYGDGTYLTSYGVASFYVFKNDILYASLNVKETFKSMLIIPDNVKSTDEAFIEYATPILKKYIEDRYSVNIDKLTLTKVDGYNYDVIINNDFKNIDMVVLKKKEGALVTENIFVDNLKEGASITSEPIEEQVKETMIEDIKTKNKVSKILGSYEFKLNGIDKLTEKIDLTFELGNEYNGKTALVSHKKSNNEYEYFEKVINDGKITITVDELSPFVVALIDKQPEKDETPNTGAMYGIFFSLILMSASVIGASLLKKKLN